MNALYRGDAIEPSSTDPDAITHIAEPSNTDTATTLRSSCDDSSKSDTITFLATLTTQVTSPPRSDSPDTGPVPTAPPTEMLRVVILSSETPPPSPPDSVIAPTGRLRIDVISTNTPPPSPPINPLDILLPPIDYAAYGAAERAHADARTAEYVASVRAEIRTGRARNAAIAARTRHARCAKRFIWALAISFLVGVVLLIVAGVLLALKAKEARSGAGG